MTPSPSGLRDVHPSSPMHDTIVLWLNNNNRKNGRVKCDDNLSRSKVGDTYWLEFTLMISSETRKCTTTTRADGTGKED